MNEDTDFITQLGRPFLAHRLRRLAETFLEGYGRWLPALGIVAPPRSLSTLLLLEADGPLGVTEIAARLRLSHPLLIRLTGSLEEQGLIRAGRDAADGRRRLISLTAAGRAQAAMVKRAVRVLDRAYGELMSEVGIDLMEGCTRVERACLNMSFEKRLERAAAETRQQEKAECAPSA
ncbi:MAG TPA: MarR family transcriptional regulator [Allosphingosinicella sp.]|nr:MarR family transcriptional regulator [Allosphingosinicella sp.]